MPILSTIIAAMIHAMHGERKVTESMTARRRTIVIRVILVVLLALSGVGYLLADRYLIEHVEIAGVSTPTSTSGSGQLAVKAQATSTAVSDDWSYESDTVSITIKEVSTGSGSDALVYFVADVVVSDATQLSSAFAKNSFGRNIIAYTSQIAADNDAVLAINGDYYGFRTDGIVIRNGVIYRDNPARVGLAFYTDGSMRAYDETQWTAEELLAEGVWNTLSFGPALITDSVIASNLSYVEVDTNIGNHPIQGLQPRTGLGIIDNNHFVFIVVDGRSKGYSRGATLTEFAQIFQSLGCTDAYNLDGGGSSTMYFMGRVVNSPLGRSQERGTSDILYIGS
jgi:exopolysaccharide biosynthesis protein